MSQDVAGRDLPARVEAFIGQELKDVDQIFSAELQSANDYTRDVLTHVSRFRGKRLRPMLVLLSAAAAGGIRHEHKVLAAVIEMIHTATLVHDDVLDEAATRRHVATVNARWNNETSVLFGDFLFTHAFHLAAGLGSTHACRVIGRATNIVCEGELSQIRERGNFDLDESRYLRIINEKTAELCAVSCLLGAHYAQADETTIQALEQFGRNLGIAFQIADDLLDILGSESQTGKSLGTDFQKQKLTLPFIRLMNTASEADAARIRELLGSGDAAGWHELRDFLGASDAVAYARDKGVKYALAARLALDVLPDSPGKRILHDLPDFAVRRSA